jgi:hypothetical protein
MASISSISRKGMAQRLPCKANILSPQMALILTSGKRSGPKTTRLKMLPGPSTGITKAIRAPWTPAITFYENHMERTRRRLEKNASRSVSTFKNNEDLQTYMNKWVFRAGPKMLLSDFINRFRSWKNVIFLPP